MSRPQTRIHQSTPTIRAHQSTHTQQRRRLRACPRDAGYPPGVGAAVVAAAGVVGVGVAAVGGGEQTTFCWPL